MVGTGFLECLESGLWNTESQCIIRGKRYGKPLIFKHEDFVDFPFRLGLLKLS